MCDKSVLPSCDNLGFFERLQYSSKIGGQDSVCSRNATLRGPGQKVVSFSLFGDVINTEGQWSWYAKVDTKKLFIYFLVFVAKGLRL